MGTGGPPANGHQEVFTPRREKLKKFRETTNKGGKINAFEQLELH
jgi:hypothetical protein